MAKKKIENENIAVLQKLKDYKLIAESNITSCLYKEPELYYEYTNLSVDDFLHNDWKVLFEIGRGIILDEKKKTLDDLTVSLYLEKHLKLKEKFEEFDGYNVLNDIVEFARVDNLDGNIRELNKWNCVLELVKRGFPITLNKLSEYADIDIDDIYSEYEAQLNHIFVNADNGNKVKIEDLSEGLDELIEFWDAGEEVGLPLENMPLLTKEINGVGMGEIMAMGSTSGTGKSSFLRNIILPSIMKNDEKILIIANEEDSIKWKKELIVFIANNVYNYNIQKYKVSQGAYTKEFKEILKKSAEYLKQNSEMFIFTALQSYNIDLVIKLIKKYASLSIKYVILDTFKASQGGNSNLAQWQSMSNDMLQLYDTIKPASLNISLLVTFQLNKSSTKQRYYTQDNVGQSKNIVDTMSKLLMIRRFYEDEMPDEAKELKVFKLAGKNGNSRVPVKLDKHKHYQIIFLAKNRSGVTDYQIVFEHDLSKNIVKEIGYTIVPTDF